MIHQTGDFMDTNDNKNVNPTRRGMPVNILLPECSLGSSVSNTNKNNNGIKFLCIKNGIQCLTTLSPIKFSYRQVQNKCIKNNLSCSYYFNR